ncbi:hypothetical protein LBMAG53_27580 [Planctomycetota bacterium]|nr:hypothetical protein LBMAG53_27580 [Planctomycetota bacterium]
MTDTHIIALGGGGFSMENSPLLDDYIISISGEKNPRICFIPTACGDADSYSIRFYRRFASVGCYAFDLQLVRRQISDLESFILSMDILYVGGGNTANMLAIWREHGVDTILKKHGYPARYSVEYRPVQFAGSNTELPIRLVQD